MYICLTENQKQYIEQETGMKIIEVKRLYYNVKNIIEPAFDAIVKVFCKLIDGVKYLEK